MSSWKKGIAFFYVSYTVIGFLSTAIPVLEKVENETSLVISERPNQPCAADVLFVLDGSSSVRGDFSIMRDIVLNISSLLNVGPYTHRVALLEFSGASRLWPKYPFGFAHNTEELMETIRRMPYIQGTTLVGKALSMARTMLEDRRPDVQTVVLVITDGFSQDDVVQAATSIQQLPRVITFALEIPEAYNMETLVQIAGNESRVIVGPNIMDKAQDLLSPWLRCSLPSMKSVISTTPAHTTPFISGCELDLVLVIDTSSSVIGHFDIYRDLAIRIVEQMNIGSYFTRVALVQYASQWRVRTPFHLNTFSLKKPLIQAMRDAEYTGGTTNTAAGLTQAIKELMDPELGARPGSARQIVIVFTDGFSQHDPRKPAEELRKLGATIYVIAEQKLDTEPNFEELWAIAGDKRHVFTQADLPKVISQLSALSAENCKQLPSGTQLEESVRPEPTDVPFH